MLHALITTKEVVVSDIVTSKVEQKEMLGILARTKSLASKIRKRTFDSTLSDDYFFNTVVGFIKKGA